MTGKVALEEGFAAARNLTLDAACGDWCLWLDADEQMQTPARIHQLLRDGCCDGFALAQMHFSIDPAAVIGTDWPCRLFRKDSGGRFYGYVHEHPEVTKGKAIPHTYMRPETKFLHSGYVDEATRRARFRRNWPLLQRDIDENPDRTLNAFLMLRDIAQSIMFEVQQTDNHVLEHHPELARSGIKLFERVVKFRQIKMVVDCMQYYSLCCEVLQSGFDIDVSFKISHPSGRDLAAAVDLKGRVYSKDHFHQLLQLIQEESTKHYESQYL
jgi:glycosyltransferase involved in cell wall biosynthesis